MPAEARLVEPEYRGLLMLPIYLTRHDMSETTNTRHTGFGHRCDSCGSRDIQFLPVAYAQSIRHTDSGYESISEFGKSIAPPRERSIIGGPLIEALGLGSAALLGLPFIFALLPIGSLERTTFLDKAVYFPALIIFFLAFFRRVAAAIEFNTVTRKPDVDRWRKTIVCRRCWHRALAPSDSDRNLDGAVS